MQTQNLQVATMPTISGSITADVIARKELPTAAEIQTWIASYVAELLEIDSDEVDVTIPFDQYGLDSAAAVGMTGDMEDWLGTKLDPTLLYDYPTVEALSRHLAEELRLEKV
jgi:acyl carrier protein